MKRNEKKIIFELIIAILMFYFCYRCVDVQHVRGELPVEERDRHPRGPLRDGPSQGADS